MRITLKNRRAAGRIKAIPSKSFAHRLFICAAFADSPTEIVCRALNEDISATMRCLCALGADIKRESGDVFRVTPTHGAASGVSELDCGESGSTLRFMLPLTLAIGADSDFICHGRLAARPLSPLYEELVRHGAHLSEQGANPIRSRGKIDGGEYLINGGVSSQFITGLLMSLPLTDGGTLQLTGKVESRPYIDITLSVMKQFGMNITANEANDIFTIPHGIYSSPGRIATEGDWSNAAFFLTAGAFSDEGVTVYGLNNASVQGDRAICRIISDFGAEVSTGDGSVTVKHAELTAPQSPIDAGDVPDLIPIVSVLACAANGTTVVQNCGRLRLKESDRLTTVHDTIVALGGDAEIDGDTLLIHGSGRLRGGAVSACGDHRIAMSAAIASLISDGDVTIDGAEAVAKSYPLFFEDFSRLYL